MKPKKIYLVRPFGSSYPLNAFEDRKDVEEYVKILESQTDPDKHYLARIEENEINNKHIIW